MSVIFDLTEEDFGLERSDGNLPPKWLDVAKSLINEYPDKKFNKCFKTIMHFFMIHCLGYPC